MKRIPITAAKAIAKQYGYDQVLIYARKTEDGDDDPEVSVHEHMTTYGRNRANCDVMARIGEHLKYEVFGWERE